MRPGPAAAPAAVVRAALPAGTGRAALLAAALLAPATAVPAEWFARSRLSLQSGYDDNVRLSTDDQQDGLSFTLSPQLVLGARSPTVAVTLDTRFDVVRYVDESDLNSDNQFLRLTTSYTGTRATLGLTGSFVRDSVQDDDDDDGNRQLGSQRRVTGGIRPSFGYRLGERDALQLAGGYQRRVYPNADGASSDGLLTGTSVNNVPDASLQQSLAARNARDGRQNSDQLDATLLWQHTLSPRTVVGGGPGFVYIDQPAQDLTQVSLVGLVQHAFTPRLRLDARAGPSLTSTDTKVQGERTSGATTTFFKQDDQETSLGFVADIGLVWAVTRRTQLETRYTRVVAPSGQDGEAVTRDTVAVGLDHELTRTVAVFVDTSWQRQERVSSDANDSGDRTTIRFEPGVRWSLTPDLDLSLRYRLRYREFEGTNDSATSNAVFLRLDLKLPDLRASW